ncbi:hypothetical protein ACVWY2_008458 [Bradyrhizobium sp. JR6.1]
MTRLYEREAQSISKLAHLRFYPLAVTGGAGATLITDDGQETSGFCGFLGRCEPGSFRSSHKSGG